MNGSDRPPLPSGWRWARLGEVIHEAQVGFACGERDPSGVVQLRMNNVTHRGQFDWSSVLRVPADAATVAAYALAPDDVLFNNTNSAELVGKAALFEGHDEPLVFSNHFTRLRVMTDHMSPLYLALWLQMQWVQGLFAQICNRWIGQAAVQRDKLLALTIPLPPLSEQRRIAAILREQMAAVERARAAAEAQLQAARALPAAYLRAAFDGPEADNWPHVELGSLLSSPLRTGISKPFREGSNIRCLTLSAVRGGRLDLAASKPVDLSNEEATRSRLRSGAFYVVRGNGNLSLLGRGALAPSVHDQPIVYPDLLIEVLTDVSRIDTAYLRWVWDSPGVRADIESRARTAAGIHKINLRNLAVVALPLPPIEKQRRIAAMLDEQMAAAERVRLGLEEQLTALDGLPAALLRRAFAGEL